MPSAPMFPAHELEHVERVTDALEAQSDAARQRWDRALDHLAQARVYDAYLEFNELLKAPLGSELQTHVQLQAVRCLRDAPVERTKTELALVDPQDAYQTMVLDYRLGWLMRHRLMSVTAALQYFERVREEARRLGSRPWEIAALLEKATAMMAQGSYEQGIEVCMRVYNLSRRNGLVEYIPLSLMYKGFALVKLGKHHAGEESLQKAHDLATRNDLVAEQGMALHQLAQVYHYDFKFFGLAIEYYQQARATLETVPVWPSMLERVDEDLALAQRELAELDIAKILGPIPINRLRQEYLTSLVNGFVGIPGIDNRSQLGERIGLTRQAIHRNINS